MVLLTWEVCGVRDMPKYAVLECERRWIVTGDALNSIQMGVARVITDKYLPDTRMRLRRIQTQAGETTFKLCKKYGKLEYGAEPIVNIYLSDTEFALLDRIPGPTIRKRRYRVAGGGMDVFLQPHDGLVIFEMEFKDQLIAQEYQPPSFVLQEITDDERYDGSSLATWDCRMSGKRRQ